MFRKTFVTIGILQVLMAGSMFAQGMIPSMSQFGIPSETLNSPHYLDAISWVYLHMMVMGFMVIVTGLFAKDQLLKKWISRTLFLACCVYTFLDFRASDSVLGKALYQGPGSLVPAITSLIFTLAFLNLSVRRNLS